MFVVIEPAEAMRQQFDVLSPTTSHCTTSAPCRRAACSPAWPLPPVGRSTNFTSAVRVWAWRWRGWSSSNCRSPRASLPVRLYTTEVDADTQQRRRLARLLLAHSRLAVVIVGDLPPHALATALLPLHDAIKEGPWPNRELLMLPLAGAAALAGQASHLAIGTAGPGAHDAAGDPAGRGLDLHAGLLEQDARPVARQGRHLPEIHDPVAAPSPPRNGPSAGAAIRGISALLQTAAPATPARVQLPMQPMPAVRAAGTSAAAPVDPALATYIRKCGELKGMVSCCVFELATQRTIGHAGSRPGPAALASQGATLMATMAEAAHALNLGDAAPDAAITFGSHHQLLRAVPGRPGLALHAVLDRGLTNLTLVRLQMQRLDLLLEDGDAG